MDVNTIIQLINGVGFPIAACAAMGAFIVWDKKQRAATSMTLRREQSDILNKLTETVENNTLVLQKLVDKMGCPHD